MKKPERILLSRTDSIGDVILTLPMAGALKEAYPDCTVLFLGRKYTKDVVALSGNIDEFIDWGEIEKLPLQEQIESIQNLKIDAVIHVFPVKKIALVMKKAGVPKRIGATGRIYHYQHCNKLVPLSRKNSDLHEAQLNFKLLQPLLGKQEIPAFDQLTACYNFHIDQLGKSGQESLIDKKKFNLILHPKSKGSAREWPLDDYTRLIELLPAGKYKIFITGTKEEGEYLRDFLAENKEKVTDLTGKFTLDQLICFINETDGLIAASTGPLHIAASLGKLAIGVFPPIKPMHPGRWAPVGANAHYLVAPDSCSDCRKTKNCHCMELVRPEQMIELIEKYGKQI